MLPDISNRVESLKSSVFAVLAQKLAGYTGKRFPLHIGDNVIDPPDGGRWENVDVNRLGNCYAYGHPNGAEALREALAQKLASTNGMNHLGPDNVLVSTGSTHGIHCAIAGLLHPGDEILLLSPYWPLVRGISWCAATVPVDVPFYQHLHDHPDADVEALITPYITSRTRMLYVISPNNPNGIVLTPAQLEALARVAQRHNLWVLSDEAYEAYAYERPHVSIATLADMAERTVTAYTFSKTYAMAGTRVAYMAGPTRAIAPMRKVATHSVYNTSQAAQSAALAALEGGEAFIVRAHCRYRDAAQLVADTLQAPFHPAQGGSFVFVDLREYGADCLPVLERAAERGVTLAPGAIFGSGYAGYARLCFTATDRDTLEEGLNVLNSVL